MPAEKMKCPRCGADMNHHGNKIVREESIEALSDQIFGGTVLESHSCPACGAAAARTVKSEHMSA